MTKIKLSILTNMVTPYRAPFFSELAITPQIQSLRVLVCSEREVDRQWQISKEAGYTVKILPGITLNLKRGSDAMRILHFRFGIFWELLRHRPDTLVIGDASWTSFLAVLACKLYRVQYAVWNEITTSSQVSKGAVSRLRRWMYRGADQLIASCNMAKNFLLQNEVPEEKIHIALNAVDNDHFMRQREQWEPRRDELRAALGVVDDAFCFIYVGHLISRKRVVETVDLLAQVACKRPVHLLVAGSGPLEGAMRKAAAHYGFDTITFCGYAQSDRLAQLYIAADSLILLSKDEPWGMVVNEAILFGKGYITTDSVAAGMELRSCLSHASTAFGSLNAEFIFNFIDKCKSYKNNQKIRTNYVTMKNQFLEGIVRHREDTPAC